MKERIKPLLSITAMLPLTVYALNIIFQNHNLGKFINVVTDEGVYLYAAKLITQGFVPYKDFFLAHPPFLMYVSAFFLWMTKTNINTFHFIYTLWFFSAIFPIFFLVRYITGSRLASLVSIVLFSTYQSLVVLDARQFALRAASLPFLAFALYFLYARQKVVIASICLGLFAICTIPNTILAAVFAIVYLGLFVVTERKSARDWFMQVMRFALPITIIVAVYYGSVLLIPKSMQDIVLFQLDREAIPRADRLDLFQKHFQLNWPLYVAGFYGILASLFAKRYRGIGITTALAIVVVLFTGKSFYDHYLTITAVYLAICAGFLFWLWKEKLLVRLILAGILFLSCWHVNYKPLKTALIEWKNPAFFSTVTALKQMPDPMFTIEPMYALYAGRQMTYSYWAADIRAFGTLKKTIDEPDFIPVINASHTVLIGPYENYSVTENSKQYIKEHFQEAYHDDYHTIYRNY